HILVLYERGLSELKRRNPARFKGKNIEDYVVAGYNHPGSVKHIHLHMALPPYKHEKVWQYPRWHPHAKVIFKVYREERGRTITTARQVLRFSTSKEFDV